MRNILRIVYKPCLYGDSNRSVGMYGVIVARRPMQYVANFVCGNVPFRDYDARKKNCFEIVMDFGDVYESFCKCDPTINVYVIYPDCFMLAFNGVNDW